MATLLLDYDAIKGVLHLEQEDYADYPALETQATIVQARVEDYLQRALPYGEYTERYRIRRATQNVPLRAIPIYSVTTIALDDVPYTGDYDLDTFGLRLWDKESYGVFSVTYKGGFGSPGDAVPDWVTRALLLQTAYEYQNSDHIGADYVTTEGGTVGRPALGLLKEVQQTLNPHRNILLVGF